MSEEKIDLWLGRIFSKRARLFNHILFWSVIYLDELLSLVGITEPMEDNWGFLISLIGDMLLVYCCLYILIPRLLLKGKVLRFSAAALLLTILNVYLTNYVFLDPPEFDCDYPITLFVMAMVSTITVLGSAVAIKMFKHYLYANRQKRIMDKAKMEAEIKSLESQMNPHFLFNALNGIYIKSKKRPEEVPEQINLLSDLLRYQLYDCKKDFVSLKKEFDYLRNYIKLEEVRRSDLDIRYTIPDNPPAATVAPFMLQPFVENAFKHGQAVERNSFIEIIIECTESELLLKVLNSKADKDYKRVDGGIGLENVKRRLELIYPNRHDLQIENSEHTYSVKLKIELQ